jgi:hypothetical protein
MLSMRSKLSLLPLLLAGAAPLAAQASDISITDGTNARFDVSFNTSSLVYVATADFFGADPAGDPAGVLFKTAWAYRIDNQTRETILNKGGSNAPTFNSAGNVGTAIWPDIDGLGKLSMAIVYTVHSTGTNSGAVTARATLINIGSAPVSVNLFHLADVDLCGAAFSANSSTPGGDGRQTYTGTCIETAEHHAVCPDRWEVGSYTNVPTGSGNVDLYTQLEDSAVTNLRNDAQPFGPYDVRGAFQWQDRVIMPGQPQTFTIAFGHNERVCAHGEDHYGVGMAGGNGTPRIGLAGPVMPNSTMQLDVTNGPANFQGAVLLGFAKADLAFGDLHVLVGNPNVLLGVRTDAAGTGSVVLNVPNNPTLCGGVLAAQAAFLGDATSQSTTGFPLTLSGGVCFAIGIY